MSVYEDGYDMPKKCLPRVIVHSGVQLWSFNRRTVHNKICSEGLHNSCKVRDKIELMMPKRILSMNSISIDFEK